jgi:predicted double-glycine peptidase
MTSKRKSTSSRREVRRRQVNRSVLDIALAVHMTGNGSFERELRDQMADIKLLQDVLLTWENNGVCHFDDCVKVLIQAAIIEQEGELK